MARPAGEVQRLLDPSIELQQTLETFAVLLAPRAGAHELGLVRLDVSD